MAVATKVSGTSPTLNVEVDHSADNRLWHAYPGETPISAALSDHGAYAGSVPEWRPKLAFVRLKITLGGTAPACSLKLFAKVRSE